MAPSMLWPNNCDSSFSSRLCAHCKETSLDVQDHYWYNWVLVLIIAGFFCSCKTPTVTVGLEDRFKDRDYFKIYQ